MSDGGHVGEVHLHSWESYGGERVAQGYAGVRVGGGIDEDAIRPVARFV